MSRVIFVGTSRDADLVARGMAGDGRLVALTADAVDRLHELGLEHIPVGNLDLGSRLAASEGPMVDASLALARSFDAYVAARSPALRYRGPGPLEGQAYQLFLSIGAVATRVILIEAAVQSLKPSEVAMVDTTIHPWFEADGYERQPWLEALQGSRALQDTALEVFDHGTAAPAVGPRMPKARQLLGRLARAPSAMSSRLRARLPQHNSQEADIEALLSGLRCLFVDGEEYDWNPLAKHLSRDGQAVFTLLGTVPSAWNDHFRPSLVRPHDGRPLELAVPEFGDHRRTEEAARLFDDWCAAETPCVAVDETDIFPGLRRRLRHHAVLGPALLEHTDEIATAALGRANPGVVCFTFVHTLNRVRFAYACKERGVPTVAYQHGGSYGTHRLPSHRLTDPPWVGSFLTYGEGIHPPPNGAPPEDFLPVGSTRLEGMRRRRVRESGAKGTKVLWIAEATVQNTVAGSWLLEDTRRYQTEVECLEALAAATQVTYRPFPGQRRESITAARLRRSLRGQIRVDAITRLEVLMRRADVAITDSSSGTTWNEAIVLGLPLVVLYEHTAPPLYGDYESDLAQVCRLCHSVEELRETVAALCQRPVAEVIRATPDARRRFLERYVLHRLDDRCVPRLAGHLRALADGGDLHARSGGRGAA